MAKVSSSQDSKSLPEPPPFSTLRKGKASKIYDSFDSCLIAIFSRVPYFHFMWTFYDPPIKPPSPIWQKILEKKQKENPEDYKLSVRVRGPWNLKNIVDSLIFRWLDYQETMRNDDIDTKEQVTNEMVNIGILSALISTIWFAMMLQPVNDDILGNAYVVIWTVAAMSMLCATVSCIFMLLAIHETRTASEATYYIQLFETISYGTGPHAPLILFYLGSLSGVMGIYLYLFEFQTHYTAVISSIAVTFIVVFFAFTASVMVSILHHARHVNDFIEYQSKKLVLTEDKILIFIKDFSISVGGDELLPESDEFLEFIVQETCCFLSHVTELRAKKIYKDYVDKLINKS